MEVKDKRRGLKTLFSDATPLTLEEELHLADIVSKGAKFIGDDNATKAQQDKAKKALEASHKIVESYSYLIETIAMEQHKNSGHYASIEDFISEAYIIALRCALTFNPHAGKRGVIRFSSYAPLAIKSSLSRLSSKSQSIIDTPVNAVKKARAFSHTMYELKNKGIEVTDEVVSQISGVDMTQQEVNYILGLGDASTIDDITPPSVYDEPELDDSAKMTQSIISALESDFFGDDGVIMKKVFGLEDGVISSSVNDLSSRKDDITKKQAKMMLERFSTLINHPSVRVELMNILTNQK